MRYCASRPSPAVDAKAMSVDIHRVAVASGSEGLTLMLEEFWVGRPKERDEISYEFPRRPAILCIRQLDERRRPPRCFERQASRVRLRQ